MQDRRIEVIEVQEDVVLVRPHAAAFADFQRHRATDHIARREVFHRRRVTLHEALTIRIGKIAALPARAFGDQASGRENAGGVELYEFHVLQWQPGAQNHGIAIASAGVG